MASLKTSIPPLIPLVKVALALDKLVNEALKTYHSESHRFLDGDIKKLTREGRQSEQKAETLHRRYVADLVDRMCEAHWRAAATVQMNNLAMKEAQLRSSTISYRATRIRSCSPLKQIPDLQAKFETSQDQKKTQLQSHGPGLGGLWAHP
ncbi:hypothetical protein H4Q26_006589 [Puccinia striiformis f. sp. tritici PST-130]|nr:hypothetical protein H4Q26_006589 [Puccinia striiformis f. sp. tritici PST-130]